MPPVADTEIAPLLDPKHVTFCVTPPVMTTEEAWLTAVAEANVHPFASVTVLL